MWSQVSARKNYEAEKLMFSLTSPDKPIRQEHLKEFIKPLKSAALQLNRDTLLCAALKF